jgi:hypothetical protein
MLLPPRKGATPENVELEVRRIGQKQLRSLLLQLLFFHLEESIPLMKKAFSKMYYVKLHKPILIKFIFVIALLFLLLFRKFAYTKVVLQNA